MPPTIRLRIRKRRCCAIGTTASGMRSSCGCRAKRGGGVVPDINYLFSFPANSTFLQSLRRSRASSLYWGEPFGFGQTLREALSTGATNGRHLAGTVFDGGFQADAALWVHPPDFCRGDHWSPALTQNYSFLYFIRFHTHFFFAGVGAKKKLSKKKRPWGDAKRGLFEKSPL